MTISNVYIRNLKAYTNKRRYIVNKGGTRSGKTYSILQLLYTIASRSKRSLMISVVSESMPHLKRGCIRDFDQILRDEGDYDERCINKTDLVYSIGNSKIEFFSVDNPGKVHGPARDILFINECQNISYSIFTQLDIRTREIVFLDYNPVSRFWVDKSILEVRAEVEFELIHSTYVDNKFLGSAQVKAIESRNNDIDWWNVYGLGITGGRDGLIYDYNVITEWPTEFRRECIAIDFGFSNDPTAVIHCGIVNGELYLREYVYETALTNLDIVNKLRELGLTKHMIYADSAEMKSIEEIRREGVRIAPAKKGKGSITSGITAVKRYKMNVYKGSDNLITELDSYRWVKDSDGNVTNDPIDKYNHALDAVRYGVTSMTSTGTARKPSN